MDDKVDSQPGHWKSHTYICLKLKWENKIWTTDNFKQPEIFVASASNIELQKMKKWRSEEVITGHRVTYDLEATWAQVSATRTEAFWNAMSVRITLLIFSFMGWWAAAILRKLLQGGFQTHKPQQNVKLWPRRHCSFETSKRTGHQLQCSRCSRVNSPKSKDFAESSSYS